MMEILIPREQITKDEMEQAKKQLFQKIRVKAAKMFRETSGFRVLANDIRIKEIGENNMAETEIGKKITETVENLEKAAVSIKELVLLVKKLKDEIKEKRDEGK